MFPGRFRRRKKITTQIEPDEILIDSQNVAQFDRDQFEGRIERPLGQRSFWLIGAIVAVSFIWLIVRAGDLQLLRGVAYAKQAEDNQLSQQTIVADRGVITDRNGVPLAYNVRESVTDEFANRVYSSLRGMDLIVG